LNLNTSHVIQQLDWTKSGKPAPPASELITYKESGAPFSLSISKAENSRDYGIFAKTSISEATCIGEYAGVVKKRKNDQKHIPFTCLFDEKYYVDASEIGNEMRFIRDCQVSGKPANMLFCCVNGHLLGITIEPIAPGTELIADYSEWFTKYTKRYYLETFKNISEENVELSADYLAFEWLISSGYLSICSTNKNFVLPSQYQCPKDRYVDQLSSIGFEQSTDDSNVFEASSRFELINFQKAIHAWNQENQKKLAEISENELVSGIDNVIKFREINVSLYEIDKNQLENIQNHQNPYVMKTFGYVLKNEKCYLIQEYMNMGNLKDLMASEKLCKLVLDNLPKIACDMASGLDFLHKKGVCHGSLCAENIFISGNFERSFVTKIGGYIGCPSKHYFRSLENNFFIAPEVQGCSCSLINKTHDVYAFGKILSFILSNDVKMTPEFLVHSFCSKDLDQRWNRILLSCCHIVASKRPPVQDLIQQIKNIRGCC